MAILENDKTIEQLENSAGITDVKEIAADDDVNVKQASIYNKIKEFQKEGFIK